ncbi:lysozyme-like protein [Ramicandelaber brevisporus]|nr:lysozyme-like protein [Ramicandelaber brevisporus]
MKFFSAVTAVVAATAATLPSLVSAGHKMSSSGLDLLKEFEGWRANYYRDSAGYWTIGYGHYCGKSKCSSIHEPISKATGTSILAKDVGWAENCVNTNTPNVTQQQFDALVSFTFNLGCGGYKGSSVMSYVKQKKIKAAADAFLRYNHAGGKVVAGLTNRRKKERALFCKSGGC